MWPSAVFFFLFLVFNCKQMQESCSTKRMWRMSDDQVWVHINAVTQSIDNFCSLIAVSHLGMCSLSACCRLHIYRRCGRFVSFLHSFVCSFYLECDTTLICFFFLAIYLLWSFDLQSSQCFSRLVNFVKRCPFSAINEKQIETKKRRERNEID